MEINKHKLIGIVSKLMHHHKGILAADESNTSANKRFAELGIAGTSENRRRYRELLLTTSSIEKYISGVILFDETLRQMTTDGELFRDILKKKDILIGIKVDQGLEPTEDGKETITRGLEGLAERLRDYKEMNAVFTKWRAAFTIGPNLPSDQNIRENCEIMAKYARRVQEMNMVPIVEPEVLIDGDHTIEQAFETTSHVLHILFEELEREEVYLGGCILKTSMVVAGSQQSFQASHEFVAERTSEMLRVCVPPHAGGVVFLSGGQSPDYALHNLQEVAQKGPFSWPLTFSFSRALQAPALSFWEGKDENKKQAQKLFAERLYLNSLARQGKLEHAPGNVPKHHIVSLRGFFFSLVVFVILLLIIF